MSPLEMAMEVYRNEPCARTFQDDLEAHFIHGMVYSNEQTFIMARYVCRWWDQSIICDPWQNPPGERDCLHIYLAAGNMANCFAFPHQICSFVSFERNNVLRHYPYQPLKRRCTEK